METQNKNWMIVGTLVVLGVSSSMALWKLPTIYTPFPLHVVLLGWVLGYFAALLMPAVYALIFYKYHASPKYLKSHIIILTLIAVLSIPYFYYSWEYGLKYQGSQHTYFVSALAAVIILGLAGLSVYAAKARSHGPSYLLSILLFSYLAWGAFPYLGELP